MRKSAEGCDERKGSSCNKNFADELHRFNSTSVAPDEEQLSLLLVSCALFDLLLTWKASAMTSLAFPFVPLISICPCWPRAPSKDQPRDDPVQVRVQTDLSSSSCRILSRNWFMVALANCFFRPLPQCKWPGRNPFGSSSTSLLGAQCEWPSESSRPVHVHTRLNCVTT